MVLDVSLTRLLDMPPEELRCGGGGGYDLQAMESLADKSCKRHGGGLPALQADAVAELLATLGHGWAVDRKRLRKMFKFSDFASALAFVNRIGVIAEAEEHHPDIELSWGVVTVFLWTHTVDGLTESDFILAAKVERRYES